jgi:very-short-patch-repair endonuclease
MRKLTREDFIKKAKEIHGSKYDYSFVNYINNKTKVTIICHTHGRFEQQPNNHITNQQNCPKCSEVTLTNHNKNQSMGVIDFTKKAKTIHGEKYDYSLVNYINKKTPVIIICEKHGKFSQKPTHHLKKCGCPQCNESKGEQKIKEILETKGIYYIKQKTFPQCKIKNYLPFDFYLPEYNTCIEFDGEQHFKPIKIFGGYERFKKQQQTDEFKNKFCCENNIKLIRISYKEKIEDKLLF